MTVRSDGSDSHTLMVTPGRDKSGDPILYYLYEVDPKVTRSDAPGSYKGAAILRYYAQGQELSGNYWTSQHSGGHFKLVRKQEMVETAMSDTIEVLLVTALKEEHDAAKLAFNSTEIDGDGVRDWVEAMDETTSPYLRGVFYHRGKILFTIALAYPLRMGGIETGPFAAMLAEKLKPNCLVMCGVCAGNPNGLVLGDLIVSELAYQYDEGKIEQQAFKGDHRQSSISDEWKRAAEKIQPERLPSFGYPSEPDKRTWLLERLHAGDDPLSHPAHNRYFVKGEWKVLVETLESEEILVIGGDFLKLTGSGTTEVQRSLKINVDPPETLPLAIKLGPIASGNAVVKDGVTWSKLEGMGMRKILGLEMEAASIAVVARNAKVPEWIVIKGVMDYASIEKDNRYKAFAARASAEALRAFLESRFLTKSNIDC